MISFKGVGVAPGRVLGPAMTMPAALEAPAAGMPLAEGQLPEAAISQLQEAAEAVRDELKQRAEAASGEARAVLEATALMATDSMLLKSARQKITSGLHPERALWEAAEEVSAMLQRLGGYMAERSRDVQDVRSRVIARLRGVPAPGIPDSLEPFVLIAADLAPADTATLDPAKVLALVTAEGGPQSHTAIIARALGLPAVVAARNDASAGPPVTEIEDGSSVYVDGTAGELRTNPGPREEELSAVWAEQASQLQNFDGTGRFADGREVPLLANVGNAAEAVAAAEASAQGIGLFRTEFLFLDRDSEPGAAEQIAAYRSVFEAFPGKKVVVRTLDAGADKPLPFLSDAEEPNPALGVRGYRTELTSTGVLPRQLEAIAQAAAGSDAEVWVMAPMISTPVEAAEFSELCRRAGLGDSVLVNQQNAVPKTRVGVMIEVPAAALRAEQVLDRVDFASLGTNDLTQYALAADRQLAPLAHFNDSWQPAVLALVKMTVAGAKAAAETTGGQDGAKPVGVCGEAAADPALAVVLAGLGVTTLSMTARAIPAVAAVLRSIDSRTAQELAEAALAAPSAEAARETVRAALPVLESLGL
ncbi:phosphoenolpyruvate--protein phosphotransferase [Acaricomes phytoseiuli]|uniref:phosphoenolpyruvate--protein phosphotransferase n=1 Tax=Acaricomes phytoseiuli TaxID=291968 RepID=UPI000363E5AB|nr:phosphoenolpyruvate--protein phosphotransferase [Acaricomes phytoseiuli]